MNDSSHLFMWIDFKIFRCDMTHPYVTWAVCDMNDPFNDMTQSRDTHDSSFPFMWIDYSRDMNDPFKCDMTIEQRQQRLLRYTIHELNGVPPRTRRFHSCGSTYSRDMNDPFKCDMTIEQRQQRLLKNVSYATCQIHMWHKRPIQIWHDSIISHEWLIHMWLNYRAAAAARAAAEFWNACTTSMPCFFVSVMALRLRSTASALSL